MSRPIEITRISPETLDAGPLASLWNEAYGDDLAVTPQAIEWCARPVEARSTCVFLAGGLDAPAGFAIASRIQGCSTGWIDALASKRGPRRNVLRATLLSAVEAWSCDQGCVAVAYGGGPRGLLRGGPATGARSRTLPALGFERSTLGDVWDMAADVARYLPPSALENGAGVVRSASPRDRDEIVALLGQRDVLEHAASGECAGDAEVQAALELVTDGGRISDLMLLWTPRGLEGLCQIVFADSHFPIEICYPYRLPRQWSMVRMVAAVTTLGEIGHGVLLDGALRRLYHTGVNTCVAPGVAATHLFTPFGFQPYRRWRPMIRRIEGRTSGAT